MGVVVYPFKEKQNYFYFDILSDYIKRQTLYHVYFQVSININDKICSCDSIEVASALTSKYIYIY